MLREKRKVSVGRLGSNQSTHPPLINLSKRNVFLGRTIKHARRVPLISWNLNSYGTYREVPGGHGQKRREAFEADNNVGASCNKLANRLMRVRSCSKFSKVAKFLPSSCETAAKPNLEEKKCKLRGEDPLCTQISQQYSRLNFVFLFQIAFQGNLLRNLLRILHWNILGKGFQRLPMARAVERTSRKIQGSSPSRSLVARYEQASIEKIKEEFLTNFVLFQWKFTKFVDLLSIFFFLPS